VLQSLAAVAGCRRPATPALLCLCSRSAQPGGTAGWRRGEPEA